MGQVAQGQRPASQPIRPGLRSVLPPLQGKASPMADQGSPDPADRNGDLMRRTSKEGPGLSGPDSRRGLAPRVWIAERLRQAGEATASLHACAE